MLPKILYIYKDVDSNNEEESRFVAAEDIKIYTNRHGPTVVGTYELKNQTENVALVVTTELKTEPA